MPAAGESAGEPGPGGGRGAAGTWWRPAVKCAVSAALLALLSWKGDLAQVGAVLRRADPWWVAAALGLYLASHALNSLRWQHYAREFGFFAGAADVARLYFSGLFVNLFLPGTIAGDVGRGLGLGKLDGPPRRAAALGSVVAHRLSGMVALLLLGGLAALVQTQVALPAAARAAAVVLPAAAAAALLWAPSGLAWLAARWPPAGRRIALPAARSSWRASTLRTLALACCYHTLQIGAVVALARSLGIDVAALTLGLFVPLINIASMVPVTMSGVGVREAGYVLSMGRIGVSAEQALALGLLGSGLVFAAGLAGAPAFLTDRPPRSRRAPG